jgi:hypothetical protein
MDKEKNTDEVVIETKPQTEVSENNGELSPESTSDTPSALKTDEEVLEGLANVARSQETDKPSRTMRTIEKEARKLQSAVKNGMIDFNILAELTTDTEIGDKAFEKFAKDQGYEVAELREVMTQTDTYKKFDQIQDELEDLKKFKAEETAKKETQSFLDFYKQKVTSYDITPSEFDALYGAQYTDIFSKYVGALGAQEASTIAFDMTIGKDHAYKEKIEAVKLKYRIKSSAVSPKQTEGEEFVRNELMSMEEVNQLPEAERIAYKKLNYDAQLKRVRYT